MKVAVLKGGTSLERTVSLRSGARVEDALARLGHEVLPDRRRRRPRRAPAGRAARTSPSSRCTAAAARTGPSRSCSSWSASRTPPRARAPASAAWTRSWPSTRCATRASRRPTSTPSRQTAFEELGAASALPAIEERLDFPIVVKPAGQGSALGIKFARTAADVPERARRRVLLRHEGRCWSATSTGRDLAVVGARVRRRARRRCRWSRRSRRPRTSTTSRRATRSAARASCARPTCRPRSRCARRSWRWRRGGRSAAPGSPAST